MNCCAMSQTLSNPNIYGMPVHQQYGYTPEPMPMPMPIPLQADPGAYSGGPADTSLWGRIKTWTLDNTVGAGLQKLFPSNPAQDAMTGAQGPSIGSPEWMGQMRTGMNAAMNGMRDMDADGDGEISAREKQVVIARYDTGYGPGSIAGDGVLQQGEEQARLSLYGFDPSMTAGR